MKKINSSIPNHFEDACHAVLSMEEVKETVLNERKWLNEYNAVSAVTDGPVEDLEGIPLPADLLRGEFPPTHNNPAVCPLPKTPNTQAAAGDDLLLFCDVVGDEGGGGISAGGIPSSTGGAIRKRSLH